MLSVEEITSEEVSMLIKRLTFDALQPESVELHNNFCLATMEDGRKFWIYICPLISDLSDKTTWRVELLKTDLPDNIINSGLPFLLMGYDIKNDTCTLWNPYSVETAVCEMEERDSFYTTTEILEDYCSKGNYHPSSYRNVTLCCFERECLDENDVILKLFKKEDGSGISPLSQYKPLGPQKSYEYFCKEYYGNRLEGFKDYLLNTVHITPSTYLTFVKSIFNKGWIEKYEYEFLKYDDIMKYHYVIDYIKEKERDYLQYNNRNHLISALRLYAEYINYSIYLEEKARDIAAPGRFTCNFNKIDRLKVVYPNGDIIYCRKSIDTLKMVVLNAGVEKVRNLKLTGIISKNGMPLICTGTDLENYKRIKKVYSRLYEDEDNDVTYYIYRDTTTTIKRRTLKKISEKLNLGLQVYKIRAIGVMSTEQDCFYQFKNEVEDLDEMLHNE